MPDKIMSFLPESILREVKAPHNPIPIIPTANVKMPALRAKHVKHPGMASLSGASTSKATPNDVSLIASHLPSASGVGISAERKSIKPEATAELIERSQHRGLRKKTVVKPIAGQLGELRNSQMNMLEMLENKEEVTEKEKVKEEEEVKEEKEEEAPPQQEQKATPKWPGVSSLKSAPQAGSFLTRAASSLSQHRDSPNPFEKNLPGRRVSSSRASPRAGTPTGMGNPKTPKTISNAFLHEGMRSKLGFLLNPKVEPSHQTELSFIYDVLNEEDVELIRSGSAKCYVPIKFPDLKTKVEKLLKSDGISDMIKEEEEEDELRAEETLIKEDQSDERSYSFGDKVEDVEEERVPRTRGGTLNLEKVSRNNELPEPPISSLKIEYQMATPMDSDPYATLREKYNQEELGGGGGGGVAEGGPSGQPGASLHPVTRKDVIALRSRMHQLFHDMGLDKERDYPTDMHALISLVQEEQLIYDVILHEVIRQVTVNMVERGEILAEIRQQYARLFSRIPRHVKNLHIELIAQRKLTQRLSRELFESREVIRDLVQELEKLISQDQLVSQSASDAHMKLVTLLTQSDNTDEVMEEYHQLYKMQRERLEASLQNVEVEKRIWIDAAVNLALRIGQEHGMEGLPKLEQFENRRLRVSNEVISIISLNNDKQLRGIEEAMDTWRQLMFETSEAILSEDKHYIQLANKMIKDINTLLRSIDLQQEDTITSMESAHPLVHIFHMYDAKSVMNKLHEWVQGVGTIAIRYTSDSDILFREHLTQLRKTGADWVDDMLSLLLRNNKTTNGKDYTSRLEVLNKLQQQFEQWITIMDRRVSGEDGVASIVISLQNQLEDRFASYHTRDMEKPLSLNERQQLKESLLNWLEMITAILELLQKTKDNEHRKIALSIENWVSTIGDQMNTDSEIRKDENLKLHNILISWMVNALVRCDEKPDTSWDTEFHQLVQDIQTFNSNLMRDSVDLNLIVDNQDIRTVVSDVTQLWIGTARRLLMTEKKKSMKHFIKEEKRKEDTSKALSKMKVDDTNQDIMNDIMGFDEADQTTRDMLATILKKGDTTRASQGGSARSRVSAKSPKEKQSSSAMNGGAGDRSRPQSGGSGVTRGELGYHGKDILSASVKDSIGDMDQSFSSIHFDEHLEKDDKLGSLPSRNIAGEENNGDAGEGALDGNSPQGEEEGGASEDTRGESEVNEGDDTAMDSQVYPSSQESATSKSDGKRKPSGSSQVKPAVIPDTPSLQTAQKGLSAPQVNPKNRRSSLDDFEISNSNNKVKPKGRSRAASMNKRPNKK